MEDVCGRHVDEGNKSRVCSSLTESSMSERVVRSKRHPDRNSCSVAFCLELKRLLARMTFCKMSAALLVQMNGLGLVL